MSETDNLTDDRIAIASAVVAELCQQMQAKYERWSIWQACASGDWIIAADAGQQTYNGGHRDMIAALRNAVAWRPLPIVPRRPFVYSEALFSAVKSGGRWTLLYDRSPLSYHIESKKKAMAFGRKMSERSRQQEAEWLEKHGWSLHKTEGVDFVER